MVLTNKSVLTMFRHPTHCNANNFELLKLQLLQLSAKQLRELRGAINVQLDDKPQVRVTDEELRLIHSLF